MDDAVEHPLRIDRIDHVVMTVRGIDETCAFYTRVLGMQVVTFADDRKALAFGRQKINLHVAGREFEPKAAKPAPGRDGRNLDHLCFRLEHFDESAIRLQLDAAGVATSPVASRYGAEGAGPSIYISDPEGNTVELKGPPWSPPSGTGEAVA